MVFAENMVANTDSVNSLYAYVSGTAVVIILLLVMAPYRGAAWPSGLVSRDR